MFTQQDAVLKRKLDEFVCTRSWWTLPHLVVAISIWSLLLLATSSPAAAQKERWDELNYREKQLSEQGKYDDAIVVGKEALQIAEATFGPEHYNVSTSLNELALLFRYQGRYAEAEPLFKHSLAIVERVFGPDDRDVATIVGNLAGLYQQEGRYPEAEPLYKRSLTINEKVLGPNDPEVATSLTNLGGLYEEEGRYPETEPLYKRSLAILEKALGPEHPTVALSLTNLALLYEAQGHYTDAEPLFKRSLAILEKTEGLDHPNTAAVATYLAEIYYRQGRYDEAEPLLKQGLATREKVLGSDHPDVASSLNDLALLYQAQGRYAEAEPLYKRSLAIREKAFGPEHSVVAVSLSNLAAFYQTQGRYAEAELLFKRSLAIDEKALGPDHPDVASSLTDLALVYRLEGRLAEAEPLYNRALAIREKILGPDHPEVATTLQNVAELYDVQGRYAEAESVQKRSLAIFEKNFGPDHTSVAGALNDLGEIYHNQGRYAEAESLLRRSLAIDQKMFGPDHPTVALDLENLAALSQIQGRSAEAEEFFERALQNISRQFQKSFQYMSEMERLEFLSQMEGVFPEYFSFCLMKNDEQPALAGRMYDLLLWEKGLVALSVGTLQAKIRNDGDESVQKMYVQLVAAKTQYARLAGLPGKDLSAWKKELDDLSKQSNDLEEQLARRVPALGEEGHLANASWRGVRDILKNSEAAVEFVRFRYFDGKTWTSKAFYVALVVKPGDASPALVNLGEAKDLEGTQLQNYRAAVMTRGVQLETPGQASGVETYRGFWEPLERYLAGVKRVYVSPDGVLNEIPLGILPDESGRLLEEKYEVRLVSSTRDLLQDARERANTTEKTAVLIGNPEFDLTVAAQREAVAQLGKSAQQPFVLTALPAARATRSRDLSSAKLPPLPGTEAEIEAVQQELKIAGWPAQVYVGSRAIKEALTRVRSPRLLHIATHGFFETDQQLRTQSAPPGISVTIDDPMLRSGLYFAGADRTLAGQSSPEGLDDGVLTAYEASTLDLHGTELVILSACATGLGEVTNGEGVFGLRRAFQIAGARYVVMSLWEVPDRETQELIKDFLGSWLAGREIHAAFAEAQEHERAMVRSRYHADVPFYWGAFILVGN